MKTLKVKINHDLPFFDFVSLEDFNLFYGCVPMSVQSYHAWDYLREHGWYHKTNENGFLVWLYPENDEDLLHCLLMGYDWWYHMSDDSRYWRAGEALDAKIRTVIARLDDKVATEIWNQYTLYDKMESMSKF